jgi:hypothetical protein
MLRRHDSTATDTPAWPIEAASPAPPLAPEELAEAEQVARRLHSELRAVVAILPEGLRGASALARGLSIDRATCQRIFGVAARPQVGAESLVHLPGILGLRQFLKAMAARKGAKAHAEQLAAAGAAVDRFEEFIEHSGGSQRRLRSRLGLIGSSGSAPFQVGADSPVAREALFNAAAAITGRWSSLTIESRFVRPVPGNPLLTEGLRIRALIGHAARPDALPLETGESAPLRSTPAPGPAFATLDAQPASGHTPASLLPEFCTDPLPRVISRSAGDRVVHVIDTESGPQGRPADIVMAHRTARPDWHPATLRPPIGDMAVLQSFPTRRLLFEVFLHRDIARRCLPALQVHLWQPDLPGKGGTRWSTQFLGGPRLEVLSTGPVVSSTPAYARHGELISHVLDQVGWAGEDFVGYRCDTAYPVWRAAYVMLFDFTGNELDAPGE